MHKLIAVALAALFAANVALAQAPAAKDAKAAPAPAKAEPAKAAEAAAVAKPAAAAASDCEAKAVSMKDGKPLHGSAKSKFLEKCKRENPPAKDAKSTQQNKMKTCAAESKGKKGQEHKDFMKACLSK
jgi:hypothetical protein